MNECRKNNNIMFPLHTKSQRHARDGLVKEQSVVQRDSRGKCWELRLERKVGVKVRSALCVVVRNLDLSLLGQ